MDYTPLNNHMRVKNHMAMWFLWFLWILRVEYSGNQLYKPLCAFLVFVDLVWFLCGSFCGFWIDCGFWLWSARPIVLMWFLWLGGLAIDADDCASTCSLWTAKKICPLSYFVLCFVSSPLGATFTNGENDHG